MATQRNIDAEMRAAKAWASSHWGQLPQLKDPKERATVYRMAYPPQGGLPDELKWTVDESLYSAGVTPAGGNALSQTVEGSNIGQLQNNVATAQAGVQKTSQPNEALRVLQEAIRAKSGIANQGIGQSDLFKEAGLTGMNTLSQSIATQGAKLDNDFSNFSNIIWQMSGTYKDMATTALNNYQMAYTAYKDESNRLQKILDDTKSHSDAIELMNQQYQNSVKLEAYKNAHPNIADLTKGEESGWEMTPSGWKQKVDTVFASPSGDIIDVGKYAQLDDGRPNPEHIAAMNTAAAQMKQLFPTTNGKLTSIADMDKYIQQYYPGSPITGQMVASAAGKYGMDWETIIATMVAETQLWTDGSKGSQMFNYGNVGNTNVATSTWKFVGLNNAQAGVDAVAKTLANPKYYPRNISTVSGGVPVDPNSKSIMSQTGLSNWAFLLATKGPTALTRLSGAEKTKYGNEWRDYQIKHNVDGATFQAQYDALAATVTANSLRNNQATVAENELQATIENLQTAAKDSGLKDLKWLNVAKIWTGQQLNDPKYSTYKMHLQQLRAEFAMYNAAVAGQIDANGNIREIAKDEMDKIADGILQDGMAKGSIEGFQKALKASKDKLQVVLKNSINAQNKQVWDLFGIGDKYQGDSTKSNDLSSQVTAKWYDYTLMKADGYSDEEIKSTLWIK